MLSFELESESGAHLMINKKDNPVAWALLMYELTDAQEHLQKLVDRMSTQEDFDEIDFRYSLAHIYSHLNRAWNGRDAVVEMSDEQWQAFSQFPKDIEPI